MNVQEFEATNFRELITELAEKNDKLLKDYYAVAQTCDEQKDKIAKLEEELLTAKRNVDDMAMQVCKLTDKLIDRDFEIARLKSYDKERDIKLHARLSDEAYRKGAIDAATKITHYLYPLWQDTTSKNVAIGKTLDWIKATFGV